MMDCFFLILFVYIANIKFDKAIIFKHIKAFETIILRQNTV